MFKKFYGIILITICLIILYHITQSSKPKNNIDNDNIDNEFVSLVYNYIMTHDTRDTNYIDYIEFLKSIKNTNLNIIRQESYHTFNALKKHNLFTKTSILDEMNE